MNTPKATSSEDLVNSRTNETDKSYGFVVGTPRESVCESIGEKSDPGSVTLSIFGEGECGEPFAAQHIVIDFTPDDAIDTEADLQKCSDFWKFVESHPELSKMIYEEEPTVDGECSGSDQTSASSSKPQEMLPDEKTALSVLSIADRKVRCACTGVCNKSCRGRLPGAQRAAAPRPNVQALCKKMTEWDTKHPKSMEPPGHPPVLSHAVMQRLPFNR